MAEWFYKANNTKLDLTGTGILATRYGFLCRSSRSRKTRGWIANVRRVDFGHLIHFYFRKKDGVLKPLGTFEVIRKEQHEAPERFGAIVEGTALYEVSSPDFVKKWDHEGAFEPDPIVGRLTGWLIRRISDAPEPDPDFARNIAAMVARPGTAEATAEPEADATSDDEVA